MGQNPLVGCQDWKGHKGSQWAYVLLPQWAGVSVIACLLGSYGERHVICSYVWENLCNARLRAFSGQCPWGNCHELIEVSVASGFVKYGYG